MTNIWTGEGLEKFNEEKEKLEKLLEPFSSDHLWLIREGGYAGVEEGQLFDYETSAVLAEAATGVLEKRGLVPVMEEDNCRLPGPFGPGTSKVIETSRHMEEAINAERKNTQVREQGEESTQPSAS